MAEVAVPGGGETVFLWFSGKGGTGKTTVSAATALQLAGRGHQVLLVSTDPAHSVSDSLDVALDGRTQVVENLEAVEVDPDAEVAAYRERLRAGSLDEVWMEEVSESLDILGQGPGVAEMAAFNKFMEFMHEDGYDVIVFDTAPTGHTLQLLQLPEVMDSMIGKVLRMRLRFSAMVDTVKSLFGKGEAVDGGVAQLEEMKTRIEEARVLMRDPAVTSFNFVMIPEKMSVFETERAVAQVEEFGLPTGTVFVNQVMPLNEECSFCVARWEMQQENLAEVRERFTGMRLVTVPLFSHEVRGLDMLEELGARMAIVSDDEEG